MEFVHAFPKGFKCVEPNNAFIMSYLSVSCKSTTIIFKQISILINCFIDTVSAHFCKKDQQF